MMDRRWMYIDLKTNNVYGPFTDEEREELDSCARPGTIRWSPAEGQDLVYDE